MLDIGCLTDSSGGDYEGSGSRTESGTECIPWNSPGMAGITTTAGIPEARMRLLYVSLILPSRTFALSPSARKRKHFDSLSLKKRNLLLPTHFECEPGVCIFSRYVCDGVEDCRSGSDEKNCMSYIEYFGEEKGFKLGHREIESRYSNVSLNECARICIQSKHCSCLSFSFKESSQDCIIGTKTSGTYPYDAVIQEPEWSYFSLNKAAEETNCQRFKRPAGTPIEGVRALKGEKVDIVEVKIDSTWEEYVMMALDKRRPMSFVVNLGSLQDLL
ncbi:Putative LOC100160261, partial [Caligus rogercresseyi]